ncbi:MAG: MBL fold metallo-hydrolase [Burkholderiales bacterium]
MSTWKIGDVTVTSIVESDLKGILGMVLPDATAEALKKIEWLFPQFVDGNGEMLGCVQAFVIQTPTRRIIVDTCIGNDKNRDLVLPLWSKLQTSFLDDLAAAGFPPETIDTVLCTHLHLDHVGWNTRLVEESWIPTFPKARYLFGRTEFEFWQREVAGGADATSQDGAHQIMVAGEKIVFSDSIKPILDAGLADLVETNHRICDEISLIPTFGHTPGHVSVHIVSNGEQGLITGDFLHHPCQIAHPEWASISDTDKLQSADTRRRMFADLANAPVLVIGTHFAPPTAGHIVRDADAYRFHV